VTTITVPSESARPRFILPRGTTLWHWALFILVAFCVLAPLTFLILGSLSDARMPTDISLSRLSFAHYREVWGDPSTYALFSNTFIYVTGAVAVGISLAAALAWLVERTDMPGKIWIYAGVPMTLAMPGMLQAMAWVLLLSPRVGFVNIFIKDLFGLEEMPFDVYTLWGMIFVEGLRLVPTAFLMLVPLLRSMDPSLEEAAAMSGASPSSTVRKITARLMVPGLFAVLIYQAVTALEVFEVPGILGMPAGIFVFSTKIYSLLHSATGLPYYGQANALAALYLAVAVVATWAYARVIAKSERYTIVTGKGYRPRLLKLGSWRWAAVTLVLAFLTFSIILPFLVFLYVSFLPFLQVPSAAAFKAMTLENYSMLWERDLIGQVLGNTIILTIVTSTATVLVSFLISLVVVRSKFWGRRVLDQLAFAPHAIPGIVMGVAFLWLFLQADRHGLPLFGGLVSIAIAFTIGYLSYGTRVMNAAILQIHKDLEEAAYVSGAVQWRTMWRVFFPLMMPAFVGVWVWTMLHVVRSASLPLILYEGQQNQVLAVLIWNMWDEGQVQTVGAMGALMILALLILTMAVRAFSVGRGAQVQS
jgi:iron(III) transport system permease protein